MCQPSVLLDRSWRCCFSTQSKAIRTPSEGQIQCQFGSDLPVVLRVGAIQGLAQMDYKVVRQLIRARRAEQEVCPVVIGDRGACARGEVLVTGQVL